MKKSLSFLICSLALTAAGSSFALDMPLDVCGLTIKKQSHIVVINRTAETPKDFRRKRGAHLSRFLYG